MITMARKKQEALPGMQDMAQIPELEEAALEYASVRDERIQLTEQEAEFKSRVHELMKKHGKMTYKCEDITIERIPGEETIKVKVKKETKDDKEAA